MFLGSRSRSIFKASNDLLSLTLHHSHSDSSSFSLIEGSFWLHWTQPDNPGYFIFYSTDYSLISIYCPNSPLLCNQRSQGLWTSLGRILFCLVHQVIEFQLFSGNNIQMSTVLEQVKKSVSTCILEITVRNMQGESVKMKNRKSGEKDIIIVPI